MRDVFNVEKLTHKLLENFKLSTNASESPFNASDQIHNPWFCDLATWTNDGKFNLTNRCRYL